MRIKRDLVAAAATIAAMLFPSPAFAATCSVDAPGINFGSYDPLEGAAVDGVGNVTVSCDIATSFHIALSPGSSGTYDARVMVNGAEQMRYNLYTSASRSIIWGDGTAGTGTVDGSGTEPTFTVYGRIEGGQNLPAGPYVDTLVVTLTY